MDYAAADIPPAYGPRLRPFAGDGRDMVAAAAAIGDDQVSLAHRSHRYNGVIDDHRKMHQKRCIPNTFCALFWAMHAAHQFPLGREICAIGIFALLLRLSP